MYWNEKINLIKKNYSKEDFSVPMVDRKSILRKIENQFITRPEDYYFSNEFRGRFSNWWANLKDGSTLTIPYDKMVWGKLETFVFDQKDFWVAVAFIGHTKIYRAKKSPTLALMNIGRTWADSYHLIDLKFKSMTSIKFEQHQVMIR
ncbi:MAG: hypothetical protein AAF399_25175, partial [Bacteroidota bacterium]